MKVSLAQTKPLTGDISGNIAAHLRFCRAAIKQQADIIVFPELSLTGYEPEMAKNLVIDPDSEILSPFQKLADEHQVSICVGAPTLSPKGLHISLIIFQPEKPRAIYSKKYLHPDEEPYFVSGDNFPTLKVKNTKVALAICYELSIDDHLNSAIINQADLYLCSVAKYEKGVNQAAERLSTISQKHHIPTMICNCLGLNDGGICTGNTAAWDTDGDLVDMLDSIEEGLLIYDISSTEAYTICI